MRFVNYCIPFLFTICTVSQLFWNRVCIYIYIYIYILVNLFLFTGCHLSLIMFKLCLCLFLASDFCCGIEIEIGNCKI